MRLRELEDILILGQPGLGQLKQTPQPTGFVLLGGISLVRKSMEMLDDVSALRPIIVVARTIAIFQTNTDTVLLAQDAAHQVISLVQ